MSALPERAYIGALLHLPAVRVTALSSLVLDDDFADPRLAVLYAGVRNVAATGRAPDPAMVDGHLRESGVVTGADRAAVTALLVDLFTEVPLPGAAESYGRSVVQEAVRRRIATASQRLAQAAEVSPLDGLVQVVADEAVAIVTACQRLQTAPLAVVA